jgi:hypothetical protein
MLVAPVGTVKLVPEVLTYATGEKAPASGTARSLGTPLLINILAFFIRYLIRSS